MIQNIKNISREWGALNGFKQESHKLNLQVLKRY